MRLNIMYIEVSVFYVSFINMDAVFYYDLFELLLFVLYVIVNTPIVIFN
jgi:hypothetical protein